MERQFTTSVYIIDNDQVLLINHKKLKKWLPPGGHLDPNETPPEAAKREAFEETGIKIELIPQENIWISRWNASSFERPFMCLLEKIPATRSERAHQHIDFIYVAKPVGGALTFNEKETAGIKWFCLAEIEKMASDVDIFEETKQTIYHILNEQKRLNIKTNFESVSV